MVTDDLREFLRILPDLLDIRPADAILNRLADWRSQFQQLDEPIRAGECLRQIGLKLGAKPVTCFKAVRYDDHLAKVASAGCTSKDSRKRGAP